MGFWVQVAEWVLSSKEDLLGQLQGCLEGDARDPPGWVLPVLLVLLPGDCRLPMGPGDVFCAWAGGTSPWVSL